MCVCSGGQGFVIRPSFVSIADTLREEFANKGLRLYENIYMILKFGFEYSFQICHEYSNSRYWMTSGIGLPYINIAVAESADRLARSFDVTLCKHCVLQSTSTRPIYHRVLRWPLHTARSCRYVRTFTLTCSCATVANGLRVCKKVSRLLPSILG